MTAPTASTLETRTPVPTNPKAKGAYRQTLMVASQTVSEVAYLEGWSTANNPSQGVIPGVCYNLRTGGQILEQMARIDAGGEQRIALQVRALPVGI